MVPSHPLTVDCDTAWPLPWLPPKNTRLYPFSDPHQGPTRSRNPKMEWHKKAENLFLEHIYFCFPFFSRARLLTSVLLPHTNKQPIYQITLRSPSHTHTIMSSASSSNGTSEIKCVVLGGGGVGKSSITIMSVCNPRNAIDRPLVPNRSQSHPHSPSIRTHTHAGCPPLYHGLRPDH